MFPAQPPKLRFMLGTRNDTFSMWMRSGRMCSRNRPWNTMTVSYAIEPQISAVILEPVVVGRAPRGRSVEQHERPGGRQQQQREHHGSGPEVLGEARELVPLEPDAVDDSLDPGVQQL